MIYDSNQHDRIPIDDDDDLTVSDNNEDDFYYDEEDYDEDDADAAKNLDVIATPEKLNEINLKKLSFTKTNQGNQGNIKKNWRIRTSN